MILAGGLGSRLGRLTDNTPKVLMEVNGLNVLERALNWCYNNNLKEQNVGLSLFHLSTQIREFIEQEFPDNNFMFQLQEENLGTAGALKKMENWLSTIFVVVNGDTITNVQLNEMLIYHFKYNPIVTVFTHDNAIHTGGVYIFDSSVLNIIPSDQFWDIKTDLMPFLIKTGHKIGLFRDFSSTYYDIGTIKGLRRARKEIND